MKRTFLFCGISSVFMVFFLNAKMYPKVIDCPSYNYQPSEPLEKKLNSIIDTNLSAFKLTTTDNLTDHWVEITTNVFVYSAYIDKCPDSESFCVLFIGITFTNATSSGSNLYCAVKQNSEVRNIQPANVKVLPEAHFKEYSAAFIYCDLDSDIAPSWPSHATLFKSSITQWTGVRYLTMRDSFTITPSLCVRPMYGSFSRIRMVEFLAYYSIMGVKHFVFYHQEISEPVQSFLAFLKTKSNLSVEILSWDMPLGDNFIHEYGQIVFTQDCIVRSRYKFSHTLLVDLDEFIVPKLQSSITDLIFYLDNKYTNAGSYTFPMVLFCDEFSYSERGSSVFSSLSPVKRQKTAWLYGFRSKYIVRPDRVLQGGVHFVWKHVKPYYDLKVPEAVALLHHYRHCCGMTQTYFLHLFKFNVLEDEVVIDNSLINFIPKVAHHSLVTYILNLSNLTYNLSL